MKYLLLLVFIFLLTTNLYSEKQTPFSIFLNTKKDLPIKYQSSVQSNNKLRKNFTKLFLNICDAAEVPLTRFDPKRLNSQEMDSIQIQLNRGIDAALMLVKKNIIQKKKRKSIETLNNFYKDFCRKFLKKSSAESSNLQSKP